MWLQALFQAITEFFKNLLPWSQRYAQKATDADKREQEAKLEMRKEVKKDGQESMDSYLNAKSRKRKR